jgi:hypothetical protein
MDHDGDDLHVRVGRSDPAGHDRDAEGTVQGGTPGPSLGTLIGVRLAAAVFPLLASAHVARAQIEPAGHALQLTALAGALRIDDDLAVGAGSQWTALAGGRAGWRPTPGVTLAAEAWFAALDRAADSDGSADGTLRGLGAFASFRPWIGRGWSLDPAFDFGVEFLDAEDEEERGSAFVFGLGIERALAGRGAIEVAARHHFLTVDEDEVDGVATGRDAEMWELRAAASLLLGGER